MPKLTEEDIKKMKVQTATIIEDPPGVFYSTFFPQDKYDDKKEAWYQAIEKREKMKLEANGLNIHGQTPKQVKEFESRKRVQEEKKRKAELAAEMAYQNK